MERSVIGMSLKEYTDTAPEERLPKKRKYLRYYLLGVIDSEGCFHVSLRKQEDAKFGWVLDPVFRVVQHKSAEAVLHLMQKELRCGRVTAVPADENLRQFRVDNRRQISEVLIPFLERYKPIARWEDFRKFADLVERLERGEHRRYETFVPLVKEAFSMSMEEEQREYELEDVLTDIHRRHLRDYTPDTPT
jgi:hypothetical protein